MRKWRHRDLSLAPHHTAGKCQSSVWTQTLERTLLTIMLILVHWNQVSKWSLPERAWCPNPQGKMSQVTCVSAEKGRPKWAAFPKGTNKNFDCSVVKNYGRSPRCERLQPKWTITSIPVTGENPPSFHWTLLGSEGHNVSFWLPCSKSCIDKCEIQKRLPGHWGSGNHTCWGVDNITNALPTVGDEGRIRKLFVSTGTTGPTCRTLVLDGGPVVRRGGRQCLIQGPGDLSYSDGWWLPNSGVELPCKIY